MSAAFAPNKGSWGLGTTSGSQIGMIRRAFSQNKGNAPVNIGSGHPLRAFKTKPISGLGPSHRRGRKVKSVKSFKDAWYDPLVESQLETPLKQMASTSGTEALFEKYSGEPSQFLGMGESSLIDDSDRLMPAGSNIQRDITDLLAVREDAETTYNDLIDTADIEEREGKEAFKIGQRDIAATRGKVAEGAEEEYAQAEATAGATGMAYSAAAEQGFDMKGSKEAMRQTGTAAENLRKGHLKKMSTIKSSRDDAETDWGIAKEEFFLGSEKVYDDATDALDIAQDKLMSILSYHKDSAEDMGGQVMGEKLKGTAGMFMEQGSEHLTTGMQMAEKAKTFTDALATDARTKLTAERG